MVFKREKFQPLASQIFAWPVRNICRKSGIAIYRSNRDWWIYKKTYLYTRIRFVFTNVSWYEYKIQI